MATRSRRAGGRAFALPVYAVSGQQYGIDRHSFQPEAGSHENALHFGSLSQSLPVIFVQAHFYTSLSYRIYTVSFGESFEQGDKFTHGNNNTKEHELSRQKPQKPKFEFQNDPKNSQHVARVTLHSVDTLNVGEIVGPCTSLFRCVAAQLDFDSRPTFVADAVLVVERAVPTMASK